MKRLADKLRGGYYTPREVTRFICEWAITSSQARVLEPSCGDGAFVEAAHDRLVELGASNATEQVLGVELYSGEAQKAAAKGALVICGDFFTQCRDGLGSRRFDAIVGNPPFIRYQDFEEEYRSAAFDLMRAYGFSPNRLTNIWLPFLVVCCHLLADDGRIGMVIPAELFQVKYAAETRRFLLSFFSNITVVTFSELLFDDAQQEVVLLLAERSAGVVDAPEGIRIVETKNAGSLVDFTRSRLDEMPLKRKLPDHMKWQAYYLDGRALDLIMELEGNASVHVASDLFEVNVGVVSGQNSFFVIDREWAARRGILGSCIPIISRSFQLDGLSLREEDFERQLDQGHKVLLFLPDGDLSVSDKAYIEWGQREGIDQNYKCRTRTPWYRVPTSWVPDAFFYRQVGAYPRMVINEKGAQTTDTLHKLRFREGVDGKEVAVAFNNSLTFVASELMGRSYGGGVLTFEPSEARSLPMPFVGSVKLDFEYADELARTGRTEQLVEYVDKLLLVDGLGLGVSDVKLLHDSWLTLRDRRLARKRR